MIKPLWTPKWFEKYTIMLYALIQESLRLVNTPKIIFYLYTYLWKSWIRLQHSLNQKSKAVLMSKQQVKH